MSYANDHNIRKARIVETSSGELYAFGLNFDYETFFLNDKSFNRCRWDGNSWNTPEEIVPAANLSLSEEDFSAYLNDSRRDFSRYFFDAEITNSGEIILMWAQPVANSPAHNTTLRMMRCINGQWTGIADLESNSNIRGIDLCSDTTGNTHLLYWRGASQANGFDGRGILCHRVFNGTSWNSEQIVDSSQYASCPQMDYNSKTGQLVAVWK